MKVPPLRNIPCVFLRGVGGYLGRDPIPHSLILTADQAYSAYLSYPAYSAYQSYPAYLAYQAHPAYLVYQANLSCSAYQLNSAFVAYQEYLAYLEYQADSVSPTYLAYQAYSSQKSKKIEVQYIEGCQPGFRLNKKEQQTMVVVTTRVFKL